MTAVALRKVMAEDASLLVKWRNENSRYFPPGPRLTHASHLSWFTATYLTDLHDHLYLVLADGRPAGTIGLRVTGVSGEIGRVLLGDRSVARHGIMSGALKLLMDGWQLRHYFLRVLPGNRAAIAFYARNGFRTSAVDGDFLVMARLPPEP